MPARQAPPHKHTPPGSHSIGQVRIIGGRFKRSKLVVADQAGLRPTPDRVRETVFNWLGQSLDGLRCLDLFAGSGALGMEAASRGAAHVDLVDRDPRLTRLLTDACARLGARQVHVHTQDALQFAARCPAGTYDIVFIDPPYAMGAAGLLEHALGAAQRLVATGGLVYLETPRAELLAALVADGAWKIRRQARAGNVHYALLERQRDLPHTN